MFVLYNLILPFMIVMLLLFKFHVIYTQFLKSLQSKIKELKLLRPLKSKLQGQRKAMKVECQTEYQIEGQIQDDVKSDENVKSNDASKSNNDKSKDDQS